MLRTGREQPAGGDVGRQRGPVPVHLGQPGSARQGVGAHQDLEEPLARRPGSGSHGDRRRFRRSVWILLAGLGSLLSGQMDFAIDRSIAPIN